VSKVIVDTRGMNYEKYLAKVGFDTSLLLKEPMDFWDEFMNYDATLHGDRAPWGETHATMAFGEGQLSVWGGINGHGKSELVGQVAAWFMCKEKVAIASFEMHPRETLMRMCRQTCSAREPTQELKKAWLDWATHRMYVYDQVDRVTPAAVLGMVHYAYHELGCKHVVIDSLTKCGVGRDNDSQAALVDHLQNAAKKWGCHIHLIAHIRKGESEMDKPGKFDLRGAAEITDLADNVLIVYRNKKKEELLNAGKMYIQGEDGEPMETDKVMPDCILRQVKNRHGGEEADYKLWRNKSGQYCADNKRVINHPELNLITDHLHQDT